LNEVTYDQYSEMAISTKRGVIRRILDELKYTESNDPGARAIRTLVALTTKKTAGKVPNEIPVNKRFISTVVTGLEKTVEGEIVPGEEKYHRFMNKCVNTIDSYGLGSGPLRSSRKDRILKMDTQLVNRLSLLFQDMIQSSLNRRVDIGAALVQYERIMEDSGILREFGKHFENHELVDDDKKTQNLETKIEKAVESAKLISEKDVQNQLKKDPEALNPVPVVQPKPADKPVVQPKKVVNFGEEVKKYSKLILPKPGTNTSTNTCSWTKTTKNFRKDSNNRWNPSNTKSKY
jgi:hypothetical protein